MPLKMGPWSGFSLLIAYRRAGSMLPVGSSHHLIEMCLSSCFTALSHPIMV